MPDTGWKRGYVHAGTFGNPANAFVDDGAYASEIPNSGCDYWIAISDYRANIPAGATINGIYVRIEACAGAVDVIYDCRVNLRKAGANVGDNKADPTRYGLSWETRHYGGAADLWGVSWSVAEINASGFGVLFAPGQVYKGADNIAVDQIQVKIYYSFEGFTDIEKIYGIPISNINKINGILVTDIEKINGIG